MSARARWVVLAVGLFVALGSVGLYLAYTGLTTSTGLERGPKTWIVQPGETLRVPADQVLIQDTFRCLGKGGPTRRSDRWLGIASFDGSTMVVDAEGNVTVHCVPDPQREA